ncbi:unnamed protein product [Ilex paraguariensis]|uniref:Uncharacterized protein n=1 Tax=Ilex paraguariensis TaxID=185542 RepID=A0ABC8R3J2_9AQUA
MELWSLKVKETTAVMFLFSVQNGSFLLSEIDTENTVQCILETQHDNQNITEGNLGKYMSQCCTKAIPHPKAHDGQKLPPGKGGKPRWILQSEQEFSCPMLACLPPVLIEAETCSKMI